MVVGCGIRTGLFTVLNYRREEATQPVDRLDGIIQLGMESANGQLQIF